MLREKGSTGTTLRRLLTQLFVGRDSLISRSHGSILAGTKPSKPKAFNCPTISKFSLLRQLARGYPGLVLKIHEVHHQLQVLQSSTGCVMLLSTVYVLAFVLASGRVLQCEGVGVRSVGVRKHLLYLPRTKENRRI